MKEKKVIPFLIGIVMLVLIFDIALVVYSKKETDRDEDVKEDTVKYVCESKKNFEEQTFPKILTYYEFYYHSENGVEGGNVIYEISFDHLERYNHFDYKQLNPSNIQYTIEEDEMNLKKKMSVSIMYEYGEKNIDEVIKKLEELNYVACQIK